MNVIDQRIHQVLDGELAAEAVPAELRRAVAQARRGRRSPCRASRRSGDEPRIAVMRELRRPAPSRARRVMRWLVTPHAIILRVRPAWSVAFAAVVAAFTLFTAGQERPEPAEQRRGSPSSSAGSPRRSRCTRWHSQRLACRLHRAGRPGPRRGVASHVVLPTGTYEYMFVVDGERWSPTTSRSACGRRLRPRKLDRHCAAGPLMKRWVVLACAAFLAVPASPPSRCAAGWRGAFRVRPFRRSTRSSSLGRKRGFHGAADPEGAGRWSEARDRSADRGCRAGESRAAARRAATCSCTQAIRRRCSLARSTTVAWALASRVARAAGRAGRGALERPPRAAALHAVADLVAHRFDADLGGGADHRGPSMPACRRSVCWMCRRPCCSKVQRGHTRAEALAIVRRTCRTCPQSRSRRAAPWRRAPASVAGTAVRGVAKCTITR